MKAGGHYNKLIDRHNHDVEDPYEWVVAGVGTKRVSYWKGPADVPHHIDNWTNSEEAAFRYTSHEEACAFMRWVPEDLFCYCRIVCVDSESEFLKLPTVNGY